MGTPYAPTTRALSRNAEGTSVTSFRSHVFLGVERAITRAAHALEISPILTKYAVTPECKYASTIAALTRTSEADVDFSSEAFAVAAHINDALPPRKGIVPAALQHASICSEASICRSYSEVVVRQGIFTYKYPTPTRNTINVAASALASALRHKDPRIEAQRLQRHATAKLALSQRLSSSEASSRTEGA